MQLDSDLVRVFVAVLVPLVPAFILYKFLPGKAAVEGEYFQGLKVKFAGAFAGYFVVMLAVFGWFQAHPLPSPARPDANTELWTVKGDVKIPDGASKSDVRLSVFPGFQINQRGQFNMEVPVRRLADGSLDFPSLQVEVHGREESIDLSTGAKYGGEYKAVHQAEARVIRIEPEIVLPAGSPP